MSEVKVYLGLGGNIGDTVSILNRAYQELAQLKEIRNLKISRLYETSPVGNPNQDVFVNAVCCFLTSLTPRELLKQLEELENKLGKKPKAKDAPRLIDIDILFYGSMCYEDETLTIPHYAWQSRLFVLVPLTDFLSEITIINASIHQRFILKDLIDQLTSSGQLVSLLDKKIALD